MGRPLRSRTQESLLTVLLVLAFAVPASWASTATPRKSGPQVPDHNGRTQLPFPVARQITFRQIGPAISGGRVAAVAGVPGNPNVYYVGAADGGVFRTSNGGTTWKALFQHRPVASVGAIAVDPRNPAVVWLGTGEANVRNDVSYGDGIWKSADSGDHWTHLGLDNTMQIARIVINPNDPNTVLVAAMGSPWADSPDRGVFRTTDGGKTWTRVLFIDASTGAADLAIDPQDPQVVYAAMYRFRRTPWSYSGGGPEDGIYKSADGGETWTRLTGHGLPKGPVGRIGLAVAPSEPNRVYAVIGTRNEGVLWRSDDAGGHWQMVSNNDEVDVRPFYFSHLAVDPGNADHVFALSMYLMASSDGGHTFQPADKTEHPDNHAIWIDPKNPNRVIEGNDGGIILSHDNGKTWNFVHNFAIGQFYHVAANNQMPYLVCGGLQDNSSYCGVAHSRNPSGITARDWFDMNGGDGIMAVPDPANPNLIYNSTQNGVFQIYDRITRQRHKILPYPRDFAGAGVANLRYRFAWEAPLAFSPANPQTVYFGGNVVFRSTDGGRTVQAISPDLTRNDKAKQASSGGPVTADNSGAEVYDAILSIAPSPKDPNVIWVGTDDGLVQITRDGGAHWNNVTGGIPNLPPWGRVETIDASSQNPGAAVIAVDRHFSGDFRPYLYQTTDYGKNWTSISGNLPANVYAHVVRQDLRNPNLLYAGLENGLYVSWNDGKTWYLFGLGLPDVAVYDIALQPQRNDLIVATHGRSLWVLDDLTPFQEYRGQTPASVELFPARQAWRYWPWSTVEQLGDGAFYGTNPPYGAEFSYYLPQAAKQPGEIVITDQQGHVVRTIKGLRTASPTEPGVYGEQLAPKPPTTISGVPPQTKEVPTTPSKPTQATEQVTPPKPGQPLKVPRVPVKAGLNRAYWDLRADGPVRWMGTKKFNRGPKAGALVPPGVYTATLIIGGAKVSQKVEVVNDPGSKVPQAQLVAQYQAEESLLHDFSRLDTALNRIDALDAQLNALKQAVKDSPEQKFVDQAAGQLENAAKRTEAVITSNPGAIEDVIRKPDRVREHIGFVAYTLTGGDGAPTPADQQQMQRLQRETSAALGDFNQLLTQASAFNRSMALRKLPGVVVGPEIK